MRTGFLVLVFLCTASLYAQVPGFQGKRLSAEGSFIFNTALGNPNENFNQGFTAFNKRFQLGAEYILGRSISIGANLGAMNSGLYYRHAYYYPSGYGYNYSTFGEDKYKQSCILAGGYIKLFKFRKRGSIAPYGTYAKLGLIFTQIKASFVETDNAAGIIPDQSNKSNLILVNYGFGKQFIIKGRFIARAGADFAINLGTLIEGPSNLSMASKIRIDYAMMFNIEAGVGVLIF
jgi:hypothetical protein